jgi:hypothetical protein
MKRKIIALFITLMVSLMLATPAFAQGPSDAGRVVFGEDFTLKAEETINGDLVVFGGNVTTETSSTIDGSLVVFGGNAEINGDVDGDMVVFGGNVEVNGTVDGDMGAIGGNVKLGENAVIEGDLGLVGGRVDRAEGAVIEGDVQNVNQFDYDFNPGRDDEHGFNGPVTPPFISSPISSFFSWVGRIVSDIFWTISLLIVLSLITWLVAAFMPEQMMNVRHTIETSLPLSFGVGLVSSIVTAVSFVLVLTICLAFVPIIAAIVLGIATLFGWIVMGHLIGERLLVASGRPQPELIVSSIFGVCVLTVISNMPVIGQIPFIGWLFGFLGFVLGLIISTIGLGAVLLTRFGNRSYNSGSSSYSYGGGMSPGGSSRVRWTEPPPEVSDEDEPSSEEELNAKIKAALAEADQEEVEAQVEDSDEVGEAEEKPKKKRAKRRKKPKDEPDEGPEED